LKNKFGCSKIVSYLYVLKQNLMNISNNTTTETWLDTFVKATYKGWECYMDFNGVMTWWCNGAPGFCLLATPDWIGCGFTPVDYTTDLDYYNLGKIDKSDFKDFTEYAQAIEPYLNIFLTEDETNDFLNH